MFRRVFALLVEVIEEKNDAKFVEVVLRITLPNAEKLAPMRIEIKV
jgi:HSP20 family molecular chaperone IbpA